ncbi:MAG: MATE family efflux transporter [Candidatus Eremiobacteraeota bacterium]|nr:MATE family efflux transporter [Candidatus Eremiobacteraeota bacterium]
MIVDHRHIGAAFRRLSIPIAVAMLGDQLLGIVDTIAIGFIGTPALAAATGASTIFLAIFFTISGFWSGVGIIAAQRIGAHDVDGFARTVRAGFALLLSAAIVMSLLSLTFADTLVRATVGPLPDAHESAIYLILRCFSMIPIAVSGTLISGLGAAGNRKLGMFVLAIINLVHIPLLFVLALGAGTHHPFGIVGAGVSTLISETIAAIFAVYYAARRPIYRIFSQWNIDWKLAVRCARLGLPEAGFIFAVMAPDPFIVAMLAPAGTVAIAAFRALNVVSDLTFCVPSPLQSATQTVIGQRLGARDVDGALSFFSRARNVTTAFTALTGVVVAVAAWPLAYIFTLNPAAASLAALPLALHMLTLPLKGYALVSIAPIRAAGDTRFSLVVGIVTSVFVVPVAYLCIRYLHLGLYGVPIAWICAWTARSLITMVKLRSGSWTRRPLIAA